MINATEKDRLRFTRDLKRILAYFAHRQNKSLGELEAERIAGRVMATLDINHPTFAYKGPLDWREIVSGMKYGTKDAGELP